MSGEDSAELRDSIAEAAAAWRDPTHALRNSAIEQTLGCDNSFTREAVEFSLDQQLSQLTSAGLAEWVAGRRCDEPRRVAVLNAGNIPFVGLADLLATLLTGNVYMGVLSSRSPFILPAFAQTAKLGASVSFYDFDDALSSCEAVLATGADDTMAQVADRAALAGLAADRMLFRGTGYGAAVLSGSESRDDLLDLAEDCLLHEGRGCRSVSVVWAPRNVAPDQFLEAAATFRGVFPAHERTAAALRMPKAMLEALEVPCAYAEDLSFLVSLGEPETREPCHVRWVAYDHVDEVRAWCAENRDALQFVSTNSASVRDALEDHMPVGALGTAQRPALGWYSGLIDPVDFLSGLL